MRPYRRFGSLLEATFSCAITGRLATLAAATPVAPSRIMSRRETFCVLSDIALLLSSADQTWKAAQFRQQIQSTVQAAAVNNRVTGQERDVPEWHK